MAVQKNRKTPSKRGMRRSHDALKGPTLSVDATPVASDEPDPLEDRVQVDIEARLFAADGLLGCEVAVFGLLGAGVEKQDPAGP